MSITGDGDLAKDERGSQDSNLESPVLETGALTKFGHCPRQWIVAPSTGSSAE